MVHIRLYVLLYTISWYLSLILFPGVPLRLFWPSIARCFSFPEGTRQVARINVECARDFERTSSYFRYCRSQTLLMSPSFSFSLSLFLCLSLSLYRSFISFLCVPTSVSISSFCFRFVRIESFLQRVGSFKFPKPGTLQRRVEKYKRRMLESDLSL